jgi:hypothetical protein
VFDVAMDSKTSNRSAKVPITAIAIGSARLFQASFSNAFDPMKSKEIFIV